MLDWTGDDALVVADQNSPEEPFHIIRLSIDTGGTRQLTSPPPHSSGDLRPVVSPDGQTLAFTRALAPAPSDIYVLPVTGGEPRRVTFDDSVITALTWSEDGGSIVFSSERGAMAGAGSLWRVRIDASTARPELEQLRGIGQRATGPVIARRGRRLAYVESFETQTYGASPRRARDWLSPLSLRRVRRAAPTTLPMALALRSPRTGPGIGRSGLRVPTARIHGRSRHTEQRRRGSHNGRRTADSSRSATHAKGTPISTRSVPKAARPGS